MKPSYCRSSHKPSEKPLIFPYIYRNMSASPDLLWALTRKTNAFLVKRSGAILTSEPNNLMGKHCFKYSGLANAEVVGVEETDAQRGE